VRKEAVIAAMATITTSEVARPIMQKSWHICRKLNHVPSAGDAATPMDDAEAKRPVGTKVIQGSIQRVHRGTILPVVRVTKITFHQDTPMHPKVATI
jgi:hypothetical protein